MKFHPLKISKHAIILIIQRRNFDNTDEFIFLLKYNLSLSISKIIIDFEKTSCI